MKLIVTINYGLMVKNFAEFLVLMMMTKHVEKDIKSIMVSQLSFFVITQS